MSGEDDGMPPLRRVELRWGHSEGITGLDVFQDGSVEKLVTCGADAELRIWKGFNDDDPICHELEDAGYALVCSKEEVFVGTEYNNVEAIVLANGSKSVKTKFTGAVNHVDLSVDGKWLVAGSGDMTIQIINLEDTSNPPNKLETHSAPVLSVALDPLKNYLASSGCDGNVCIWTLTDEGKPVHLVKKFEGIYPSSNDLSTSQTLCRLSWESNGKILAVPEEGHVALYARESWVKLKVVKGQKSKAMSSVTKFSPCGTYLASGAADGTLIVWNVKNSAIVVEHAEFSDQITALTFTNDGSGILAADKKGRVLLMKDFKTAPVQPVCTKSSTNISNENDVDDSDGPSSPENKPEEDVDEFDDGLDNLFTEEIDDNEISISKIKAESGFVDDEYVGVDKAKVLVGGTLRDEAKSDDDDAVSVSSIGSRPISRGSRHIPPPRRIVIPFTEPQKPFQPGSSPAHIEHRFMIWNNTGIIRSYSLEDDEKGAIDIEFHDAAVHHAIHLRNQYDYKVATLTKEVAVFASEKDCETGSKLFCYSFAAWDTKKEWSLDLPLGEEVIGLASGDGWIAASTDMNRIRIFTIGGAQKQIVEIGGQIITISAQEDLLFVVFHNGIGLYGNQCIAFSIFKIKPSLKPFPLISSEPLPISPKSQVSWIGFSDEGTPVCSDSTNILRILSGRYWTTFCTMKEHLTGASDHFWVVGVSELDQRIRAVKCRGMKYPPTLPRPVLMQLDAQIPFCEIGTEKSRLEDRLHRSLMLDALSKKMDKKNYEVDDYKTQAEKELKESLFNLFVLSCKGDWDARGTEYVSMMPSAHAVQVAVKYASKLRKKGLMDRLAVIGRRKVDEEELAAEGDDDDFETLKMGTVVYSNVQNRTFSATADYSASQDLFAESSFNTSAISNSFSAANRSVITVPDEENPFIRRNTEEIRKVLGSIDTSGSKFRKGKIQDSSENGESKGLSVLDSWKKPSEKSVDPFAKTHGKNTRASKKAAEKDKTKDQGANKDKKKQTTLFDMHSKKSKESSNVCNSNPESPIVMDIEEQSNDSSLLENQAGEQTDVDGISKNTESLLEDSTNTRPLKAGEPQGKKGYLLWYDENKESLENDNPDASETDISKIGIQQYRQLSAEEKQRYLNPNQGTEKKRKRSDVDDDPESTKPDNESEKKSKISSKLAKFVRSRYD